MLVQSLVMAGIIRCLYCVCVCACMRVCVCVCVCVCVGPIYFAITILLYCYVSYINIYFHVLTTFNSFIRVLSPAYLNFSQYLIGIFDGDIIGHHKGMHSQLADQEMLHGVPSTTVIVLCPVSAYWLSTSHPVCGIGFTPSM